MHLYVQIYLCAWQHEVAGQGNVSDGVVMLVVVACCLTLALPSYPTSDPCPCCPSCCFQMSTPTASFWRLGPGGKMRIFQAGNRGVMADRHLQENRRRRRKRRGGQSYEGRQIAIAEINELFPVPPMKSPSCKLAIVVSFGDVFRDLAGFCMSHHFSLRETKSAKMYLFVLLYPSFLFFFIVLWSLLLKLKLLNGIKVI